MKIKKCQIFFSPGHCLVSPTYEDFWQIDLWQMTNVGGILQHFDILPTFANMLTTCTTKHATVVF